MKTLLKIAIATCLLLAAWSCEKKETNTGSSAITLFAPADGASFDLAKVPEVVFDWSDVERVMLYDLRIGRSSDLTDAVSVPLAASPQIFPARKLDAVLDKLGVAEGQQAALYWSVVPAIPDVTVATQVRAITLTRSVRPVIRLTAPADGATVDGNDANTFPVTFAWTETPGVDIYVLKLSVKNTFPKDSTWQKVLNPANDDVWLQQTFHTAEALDSMLNTAGVPINEQATIYWTVEPQTPTDDIVSLVYTFTGIRPVYPVIFLTAPNNNENLSANLITFPLRFTWQKDAKIPNYTITFTTDTAKGATPVTKSYNKNGAASHTFTANEYDALLADLGINLYVQKRIYWTVEPTTKIDGQHWTFTRSFTAARKTVLKQPAGGASVVLNYKDLTDKVRFEWETPGTAELVVATDANGSHVLFNKTGISGTTIEYDHSVFQALIDNTPTYHLKRYKANELYWNIRINGSYISVQWCPFKLYGQRIFVDDRKAYFESIKGQDNSWTGSEPGFSEPVQDYEVAVLEYNGKEVVWLAEDVRTTVPWDDPGEYITHDPQHFAWPPTPAATEDGVQIPEKYRTIRETVPRTGIYYDYSYMDKVVPQGWKMPMFADWEELFKAAVATFGDDKALRHPDYITGTVPGHANAWGMNFIPLGRYHYICPGGPVCTTYFYWDNMSLAYQYDPKLKIDEDKNSDAIWDGYLLSQAGLSNGTLYRAIYTGDGE
jgi:hypothetical protein